MGDLLKIAMIYDGNYFYKVSNYYKYHHSRGARIKLDGLHRFVQDQVANLEQISPHLCRIVAAHYFRGRFGERDLDPNPERAEKRLRNDLAFDDALGRANITSHYAPMNCRNDKPKEVGIDVMLALETYDLAIHKNIDVVALVAGDSDFGPLARKLNTNGTRVMLLAWDFQTIGAETRTSKALIHECSYPIMMHEVIDNRARERDPLIDGLFMEMSEVARGPSRNGKKAA